MTNEETTTKAADNAGLVELDCYDAGLLGDGGGGDVDWWQNYIRVELARAHEFYSDQIAALSFPIDRNAVIKSISEPSARMVEAVCAAGCLINEQWPDGFTDGEQAIRRIVAEKQIAAILDLIEQEGE